MAGARNVGVNPFSVATALGRSGTKGAVAIAAALGFTPAASNNIGAIADGSAAAPALSLANATTTGFFKATTDSLGIAAKGVQALALRLQNGGGGTDTGVLYTLNRAQTINTGTSSEHYAASFFIPTQTITGDTPAVLINFGLSYIAMDTGTKSYRYWTMELDKCEYSTTGGAVTMSSSIGCVRIRVPFPTTSVTAAQAIGYGFTPPNATDVTGTITLGIMGHYPAVSAPAVQPTNGWYGNYFEAGYTKHLMTASGVDLAIGSAAAIGITADTGAVTLTSGSGSAYHVVLNAPNSSGLVRLQTQGTTLFTVGTIGATAISNGVGVRLDINNTPSLYVQTSSGSAGFAISSKQTTVDIYTGGAQSGRVMSFAYVASAVNYILATPGATGNNPRLQQAGTNGNLVLGSGSALATGYTDGGVMIPTCAGTPTGAPTGAGAGQAPIIYDTSANKLWVYNGGWRSATFA